MAEFNPYEKLEARTARSVTSDQRRQELQDIVWLMDSGQGRRILSRLMAVTGVFHISMTGNSLTYYNEGRRSVGLELLADVNEVCPEKYILMLNERIKDDRGVDKDERSTK